MHSKTDDLVHTLRKRGTRYVVDARGQPLALLLTPDEYDHCLDLLDDETDGQDVQLTTRLRQASGPPADGDRQVFRDYLRQR